MTNTQIKSVRVAWAQTYSGDWHFFKKLVRVRTTEYFSVADSTSTKWFTIEEYTYEKLKGNY